VRLVNTKNIDDEPDVLIIGAGASGGVAALELAQQGLKVVCLEQGGWNLPDDFTAGKPEWELTRLKQWNASPNVRQNQADYPIDSSEFEDLRESLEKLSLNDSSFTFVPETSEGLGFGFRCGFLGMLHREIIQQRIERDSGLELVHTAPNVTYEILKKTGETLSVDNPQSLPDSGQIEEFREPIVRISFILPSENIGDLMQMCTERRGTYVRTEYLSPKRAILVFDMPLAEVIYDLYDRLKSVTHGYGTMDYDILGFVAADLVKLDVLVHGNPVDALSTIVHRAFADRRGRALVKKLRSEIDRHQFEIAIQAAIGTKVIARETITAMRKNVTAKCYGGDISRKKKLWAKQAKGKKRMKQVGLVEIPQEAFLAVLESE